MSTESMLPTTANSGSFEQMPTITLSGVNHRSAAVDVREKLALDEGLSRTALKQILSTTKIDEAVVVSTCNRVEVVTASVSGEAAQDQQAAVFECLAEISGVPHRSLSSHLYHLDGTNAVGHVFRVASGLDSLVVGEPQILGQLKSAYEFAQSQGATSRILNRLFHRAFGVAKAVRSQTKIGQNAVSVAYAGRELARQIFGDLCHASVLLIGTGETGVLATKHFVAAGVRQLFVASRSLERASALARECHGVPLVTEQLGDFLPLADIVIGATGLVANESFVLSRTQVSDALAERVGRVTFFIDLGVPRNFDPEISEISDAFLYNIDDLEGIVKQNVDARLVEAESAQSILEEEVEKFGQWLHRCAVEREIGAFMREMDHSRMDEVEKTVRRLHKETNVPDHLVRAALDDFSRSWTKKLLHQPLNVLREEGADDGAVLALFKKVFQRRE